MSSAERDEGRQWIQSEVVKAAAERGVKPSEPVRGGIRALTT